MSKNKTNEATGGYYNPGFEKTTSGFGTIGKSALMGLGLVGALKWLEKHGDTLDDERNKEELKQIKKSLKGYNPTPDVLSKTTPKGMKLKNVLKKLWTGN